MTSKEETLERIAMALDCLRDARAAAQAIPGNNWPLRKALLEGVEQIIEVKRQAIHLAACRDVS